jgi:hypothetical protein
MDGYTLIDKMRKVRRRFRFTAIEQALYHELVSICNNEGWSDVFGCSNTELCFALDITEPTLIKSRESLVNSSLLFYQSGNGRRSIGSYSFEKETKAKEKAKTILVDNEKAKENTKTDLSFNAEIDEKAKENTKEKAKTILVPYKENNKQETKTRKKDIIDLIFPFQSEKFLENWKILADMPKWKKKIPHSLQLALNSLGKYEEEFAVELIEKAIEGNWQGVTFTNTPDDYQKWKKRNGKNQHISSESQERAFLESVVSGIGRAEFERNNNLQ